MSNDYESLFIEAIKSYNDDRAFLHSMQEFYRNKYPGTCAGEGTHQWLFDNTINLLNEALKLNPGSWQVYLLLSKALKDKSYLGEGCWDDKLLSQSAEYYQRYLELTTSEIAVSIDSSSDSNMVFSSLERYFQKLINETANKTAEQKLTLYTYSQIT